MGIDKLPKPGASFSLSNRNESFMTKLRSAVRFGEYKNVLDNLPAIESALKPYQEEIRLGGLNRLQRLNIWRDIKSHNPNMNKADERDIKKIIDSLSEE